MAQQVKCVPCKLTAVVKPQHPGKVKGETDTIKLSPDFYPAPWHMCGLYFSTHNNNAYILLKVGLCVLSCSLSVGNTSKELCQRVLLLSELMKCFLFLQYLLYTVLKFVYFILFKLSIL